MCDGSAFSSTPSSFDRGYVSGYLDDAERFIETADLKVVAAEFLSEFDTRNTTTQEETHGHSVLLQPSAQVLP